MKIFLTLDCPREIKKKLETELGLCQGIFIQVSLSLLSFYSQLPCFYLLSFFLSSSILFYRFTFSFIHHLHVKFADQSQDFADEKLDILMNALHIAKHPDERELGKYDF